MRKLIKKSLAICLVAMLVLSAFVGTFAVSAESVATVTASEVEVEAGTTEVTVPVTIEVTDGFYAAFIQVQSEFGALTAVTIPDLENAEYNVTADDYTAVDLATGKMLVMSIYGDDTRNDITEAVLNCTFTADAAPAAGDYAVTVTLPEVPAADWAESVVALTPVAGKVTVKEAAVEPGLVYTSNYGYDVDASKFYVGYEKPSAELIKKIQAVDSSRKTELIITMGEGETAQELPFDYALRNSAGTLAVSGFALQHLAKGNMSLHLRITGKNNGEVLNLNAFTLNVVDFLNEKAATDEKIAAWVALNNVWASGNETIDIASVANIEEGDLTITGVEYSTETSALRLPYAKPSNAMIAGIQGAGVSDDRIVQIVLEMNNDPEKTLYFDQEFKKSAGTMIISGFSLTHLEYDLKVYVRVTSKTNPDYLYETNAVSVNIDNGLAAATNSAFADAYNALKGN